MATREDWIGLAILFGFVLLLALLTTALAPAQVDEFEGWDPHAVPRCAPRASDGVAKCDCLGMTASVQEAHVRQCWGGALPTDPLGPLPTQEDLMQCLGEVPSHCEIVARPPQAWDYKGPFRCKTSCRPEKCGCGDEACRAHGAPDTGL